MNAERTRSAAGRRGFTLIELLLVLVILAVLAMVVVPKFAGRSQQAKETAARTGLSSIKTALAAFEVDCSRYPTTQEGLAALVEQPAGLDGWKGYMDKVPLDPWKNPFQYRYPGEQNRQGYDLWSRGPDGKDGGGDDITNWDE